MIRVLCRVGCEFLYESPYPTPAVFQVQPRLDGPHRIVVERTRPSHELAVREYLDSFGNRCTRLVIPEGSFTFHYDAIVETVRVTDAVEPAATQLLVQDLPDDTLIYTMPSRYVDSDVLSNIAWELFGGTEPGWSRVQAICDWVHTHVTFQHGSMGLASASEVYLRRRGVCRDFAQLGVAFCRALNIPARYGFGYMGDIDVPVMDSAMDFHAWFEVYLGGRWYTFDCRHNVPRVGRIFIGKGRDAVDVAMVTTFGPAALQRMTVWADEVPEGTTLEP